MDLNIQHKIEDGNTTIKSGAHEHRQEPFINYLNSLARGSVPEMLKQGRRNIGYEVSCIITAGHV